MEVGSIGVLVLQNGNPNISPETFLSERTDRRPRLTSMCLSSSFSSAGYLSSLVKGLLRLVVSARMPGLDAPLDSMNPPSSSLEETEEEGLSGCSVFPSCIGAVQTVPVARENADSRRVVGAVGHVDGLHLRHQAEEEAANPLLVLRKSVQKVFSHQTPRLLKVLRGKLNSHRTITTTTDCPAEVIVIVFTP